MLFMPPHGASEPELKTSPAARQPGKHTPRHRVFSFLPPSPSSDPQLAPVGGVFGVRYKYQLGKLDYPAPHCLPQIAVLGTVRR